MSRRDAPRLADAAHAAPWPAIVASGLAVGAVSVAFHAGLDGALAARESLTARAHPFGVAGALGLAALCAAAVVFAVWLTQRFAPQAAGSGIQHVKGVEEGRLPVWPLSVLWVKFVGGIVGIGGGLFLGREGPTVQMGSSLAEHLGRRLGYDADTRRVLLVVGAGAGLAGAFNAPLAGTLLVVEEFGARFVPVVYLGTLMCAVVTDVVVRASFGRVAELSLPPEALAPLLAMLLPALLVGAVAGGLGALFNGSLLRALDAVGRCPARVRLGVLAVALGAGLGVVAWFLPTLPGDGTGLAARVLAGGASAAAAPWLFLLVWALTIASYAIGAPGGIFAPLLALGSLLGVATHAGWLAVAPATAAPMPVFATAGMAGLFAGSVRSPLTGTVLLIELTGSYAIVLPLAIASLTAYAVAAALGGRPIYDTLLERECARRAAADGHG